ncbi:NADH-quinone oxidoreductase subunit C [uncultured Piscinibacter sp.]|uniref:hydrogenase large subunit n=1 Tax=uncultured Piscinibacter sp. TaxID=1131835 RepID=UPI00262750A8|nr:NADH-quinone oxidoreductase subunit C [uncultured Piscinibacter sp.]
MALSDLHLERRRVPAPLPIWHADVDREGWLAVAREHARPGGRLVSMWGVDRHDQEGALAACAALASPDGLLCVTLPLAGPAQGFPDLSELFAGATRMQRAMADLSGLHADAARDQRPWLDHGLWRGSLPPLAARARPEGADAGTLPRDYPFVRVEGDGVHEIPVGPVHAGIIEPGHFRFSVVGEKVLRLEERLGYTHKGIERRFTELTPLQAHRLAGRVSGDSTVAYAWAYCMALESACDVPAPERAQWLRALLLERERVANHLGDLGALGNDAALAFGLAQFSRLREDWQRLSKDSFGHRLMMDAIVPGGVAHDLVPTRRDAMLRQCDEVERDVHRLRQIYDEHAGLQDRFMTTGRVTPELAARLGLTGMAGRASGQAGDLRCDLGWQPYGRLGATQATQQGGDVAARVALRFDELFESLRLIRELCGSLPDGDLASEVRVPPRAAQGTGWVEGWRGEVLVALHLGDDGRIVRCHCHDPSWQNWPVLEHAVIGNIVPDFPLINKSFNLSYSGHDL